ncbi:MAG TPA: MMPL family transporter [Nitrososphaerales archaeon]|nr:MMPL family transporter [Nitrososphaerales archaeon]
MKSEHSLFDPLNAFIRKRYRIIVVLWILALVLSAPLVSSFFSSISFNVSGGSILSVPNSESEKAQAVLDAQFPSMNQSSGPIIVVFQDQNVYSSEVKNDLFSLNQTLSSDRKLTNFTGILSLYNEEESLLNSTIPIYLNQIAQIAGQIPNSNNTAAWDTAARDFVNSTSSLFASSPLFTVNSTSFYNLLSELNAKSTPSQIQASVVNLLMTESLADYPYSLSSAITKNFASSNNETMIFEIGFSSTPSNSVVIQTRALVHNSSIASLGTIYVTGLPVIAVDFQSSAQPALSDSIAPGLAISLLVAGLLFFSPVAALVPLVIGGFAIGISLGSVYGLIVLVQHSQINFAVPFLMILTMLGLAVDYSILQLRRTKEERTNGKSLQDSVAISVRWAGQAILTAGLTVVAAYVVLSVTRVPFFGDVGTAIAIGVVILLAASLTLLPSLELVLGERLFWPKRGARTRSSRKEMTRLERVAEKTIQHKIAISVVIALLAAGSFYLAYQTPSGIDITKLIPNFESNQGLTAITNNLGGSVASPTLVVVSFPYPVVHGQAQFNQTELNQIETISSTISNSVGVDSVTSPTRPFSSPFNYTGLGTFTLPVSSQYLIGMLLQIGKDNKTALITVGLSQSSQSSAAVTDLRNIETAVNAIQLPTGSTVYFGGSTQSTVDSLNLINGDLPLVLLILSLGVYFILFAQLRSLFTPLRLIFTILCSVAFALALLSIAFYYLLQTPVVSLAPLFVVVTMLGVGIDYDIFLVTRIREEVMSGKSDHDAIESAINKIWVTLFGLGLILSSVFASLVASGIGLLQEIGVSVASAVMVDVGIVILFFVPSLMAIAQKYNWWPSKIRRESNP